MPDNRGSMPPMDDKFLKERYDYELARKEKLSDSLGMPVSVVILLSGLVVTMIRGFTYTKLWLTVPFGVLVAFDVFALARCLWFLAHAYHGQTYEQLPSLGELYDVWQKYYAYYGGTDHEEGEKPDETASMDADIEFQDNFRYRIIKAADQNRASNISKQSCLHLGIVWLFALLVGTAVSSVPYAIDQIFAPSKVPVMHLDNLDQGRGSLMPTQQQPAAAAPSAPAAPKPQPQANTPPKEKPQFPPNTVFRNDQPVKQEPPKK